MALPRLVARVVLLPMKVRGIWAVFCSVSRLPTLSGAVDDGDDQLGEQRAARLGGERDLGIEAGGARTGDGLGHLDLAARRDPRRRRRDGGRDADELRPDRPPHLALPVDPPGPLATVARW